MSEAAQLQLGFFFNHTSHRLSPRRLTLFRFKAEIEMQLPSSEEIS